jgi:acyl-CoA thioesterase
MPGRLKIYDGTQFIEINDLPQKGTNSFTTLSVNPTGGTNQTTEPFNNRSWVRKLKVTPTDGSVNSFVIELFSDSSFSDPKLEYQATASGTYIDNAGWFHEDEENTEQLYLKLTNNSLAGSTFTIELTAEVFA